MIWNYLRKQVTWLPWLTYVIEEDYVTCDLLLLPFMFLEEDPGTHSHPANHILIPHEPTCSLSSICAP